MDLNNKKCKSVREFFDYLIASGQLLESQKSYDEKPVPNSSTAELRQTAGMLSPVWTGAASEPDSFVSTTIRRQNR